MSAGEGRPLGADITPPSAGRPAPALAQALPAHLAWLQALREPSRCLVWSPVEWEQVLRLARRLRLLARLGEALAAAGLADAPPPPARRLLLAEQRLSGFRMASLRWTAERVGLALHDAPYPRVLLKGAAYAAQGLGIGAGRLPSDLDILVPKAHVADAQARLKHLGWQEVPLDAHDQHYYHAWSHEVPPMHHTAFTMELDLHHTITPPLSRHAVDAQWLLARLQPSHWPGWQVLHPIDQILHSAAHLFHDAEPRERVRDLVDLDALLRLQAGQADFWPGLAQRAGQLNFNEALALALHFCHHWLDTPVPPEVLTRATQAGLGRGKRHWLVPMMHALLEPAPIERLPLRRQRLAAQGQLLRYHLHRLPLRLLVPHLWHKLRPRLRAPDEVPPKVGA